MRKTFRVIKRGKGEAKEEKEGDGYPRSGLELTNAITLAKGGSHRTCGPSSHSSSPAASLIIIARGDALRDNKDIVYHSRSAYTDVRA